MRRSLWLLPVALVVAGPVASAPAQGCSGVVCRTYTRTRPASAPQSVPPAAYEDSAVVMPQTLASDSDTSSAPQVGASATEPAAEVKQPMMICDPVSPYSGCTSAPAGPVVSIAPQPTPMTPNPVGTAKPVPARVPPQTCSATPVYSPAPMVGQPAPAPGTTSLPQVVYPVVPAERRGLLARLFHRDKATLRSSPTAPNEAIMMPSPSTVPAPRVSPPSQPTPMAPAVGPTSMKRVAPESRCESCVGHAMYREPSTASSASTAIVLASAAEPARVAEPRVSPAPAPCWPCTMPAETVPVKEAAEAKMDNEFAGKFPIKPAYLGKVGHAADMSWLTGPAYHLQADGDMWVVRYARAEEDPAGGLVVLDTALSLKSVHEGDLVSVYGNLRRDSSGMSQFRVPVYKADRVFLLERGNP